MANGDWLKPIMIVLAIFIFIVLVMELGKVDPPLWGVDWDGIRDVMIDLLPWLVGLGVGVFVLVYVMRRR